MSNMDDLSPPNQQGTGSASSSTSLCARNKNTCDDMKDAAEELVEEIWDAIADAADGEPAASATATASTLARNATTVVPTPTPMPNLNTSSWMDLYDYRALFTEEEYSMLQEDPLCFYANFGRLYENYAVESRTSTGSAPVKTSSTAATATAQAKRTVPPPPTDDDSTPCLGCDYNDDSEDSDASATATGIDEGNARTLYLSYLPDQLRMVYTSTPTSLTVTATATTSCSGLSGLGIESFETPYVVFGYRDGYAPTETASVDDTSGMVSSGASDKAEFMPLGGLLMLGILWLARIV